MSEAPITLTAPQSVRVSVIAYMIGAALGIVVLIVSLVTIPLQIDAASLALRGSATAGNGVDTAAIVRGTVIGAVALGAVFGLAFAILTFVFARKMAQGRNWARITLLVFAVLQLFGVLGAYGLGFLHFAAFAVGAIFSFLPTASVWFRAVSPRRAAVV